MENTRYKILLIEDDKLDQMAFQRLIKEQQLPYDCTIAGSASEAKKIIDSACFDVVISDYSLGDGTAFDILGAVKDTPVILITGAGDEETAVKAWKAGAYDYLVKDLERKYLKAVPITIENAIKHQKTREQLHLLSGAIMSTDESIYITDMQGKIIFVNRAFCETYGYRTKDILGKDSKILWIGRPQIDQTRSVFQTRAAGGSWEVGFYHQRKDGSIFPVSLSRSIIKGPDGKEVAVVAIGRDITERILVEDKLRTESMKLEEQNRLKSELAVMVSEMLNRLLDKNDVHTAQKIINDYLDLSKIDVGKLELKPSRFNICSLVSEVIAALSPLAVERNIELTGALPDSEIVVEADQKRTMQILSNIINHTIRSVRAGGHICVQVTDNDEKIKVEVKDNDPLIEPGQIFKMFNYFAMVKEQLRQWQERKSPSSPSESPTEGQQFLSGLGLPVAKELVEMHGGQIWVESTDASFGNNFCFTLPKARVQPKAVETVTSVNEISPLGNERKAARENIVWNEDKT